MPGGLFLGSGLANGQAVSVDTSISSAPGLFTGASANTKGSWGELISATTADLTWIVVSIDTSACASTALAVDIAVAGAGVESSGIIVSNILVNQALSYGFPSVTIPVNIPAGSRIAARASGDQPSDPVRVHITGWADGVSGPNVSGLYDTICGWGGTGVAGGVALDPGATANTMSAYTQLVSSTSNDYAGIFMAFDYQNNNATGVSQGSCLLDIAVGGSGSEQVVINKYFLTRMGFNDGSLNDNAVFPMLTPFLFLPIAAGTRIAARVQSSLATATFRKIGISLYGLRA